MDNETTKQIYAPRRRMRCNWQALRRQLLEQWNRVAANELDRAGPDPRRIALLIERHYGVASVLVENYLHNFERTLPMAM